MLVMEVPEQEGADGTPVPLGGGVCGPPLHYLALQGSLGGDHGTQRCSSPAKLGTPGPCSGSGLGAVRHRHKAPQVVPRCTLSDHPSLFTPAAHLLLLWPSPFYPGCCYEISLSA